MKIISAEFVISSPTLESCPLSNKPEIAFIGRSNVGKSSLINMLTNRKSLAKTSGEPGKTQLINHFIINNCWHLVDLPGYGWAKVSKKMRAKFATVISDYLEKRKNLACAFVLVDIRLTPQPIDLTFINWMGEKKIPFAIVFTKADKLSNRKLVSNRAAFEQALKSRWEELPLSFISSSPSKIGKEDLLLYIEDIMRSLPSLKSSI